MAREKVLLLGATGETGRHILDALIDDDSFDITCFIRTSSADKPSTQQLRDRGISIVAGELDGPAEALVALLEGVSIVISSMAPAALTLQIPLIDAAVQAGVKRFLPCNYGTPSARGILALRDVKEDIHDHMFRRKLGFTIVDVGFWYQASVPRVPSGKFDGSLFMTLNEVYAGGATPNMLIDARDVGKVVVRVIKDERTLNRRVIAYGNVLSQNEVHELVEAKTGEKLELSVISDDEAQARLEARKAAMIDHPGDRANRFLLAAAQYAVTKYIRGDNTPENARYLGYINALELFPDMKLGTYANFIDDLIAGKIERPYPNVQL